PGPRSPSAAGRRADRQPGRGDRREGTGIAPAAHSQRRQEPDHGHAQRRGRALCRRGLRNPRGPAGRRAAAGAGPGWRETTGADSLTMAANTSNLPLWRTAFRRMRRRPLQYILLVVGVAVGVAMMVSIDLANGSASR